MNYLKLITVFCFLLPLSVDQAQSTDSDVLPAGCGAALHLFWKGRMARDANQARQYFQETIELCPGYIRPYELVGNFYRKENQPAGDETP